MTEPSALLLITVDRVLLALRASGQIEMDETRHDEVVRFCAVRLANAGMGAQLVDSLSKALLASDHVDELYADDKTIKGLITGVGEP